MWAMILKYGAKNVSVLVCKLKLKEYSTTKFHSTWLHSDIMANWT